MEDRTVLLERLRIDREDEPTETGGAARWVSVAAVTLVVAGAAIGWYLYGASGSTAVQAAVAEPVAVEAAAMRGSILDASGYVVARRQATVSAKITGKVVDVLIEEGQRVAADEVIARLDPANALAAVAQAEAQHHQARASLNAARIAFDNFGPLFARNAEQYARQIISAQSFDTSKAEYDAARASLEVAARAVEVAEANLAIAERNLEDTIVRAPFAGVVTVKAAQEGEMVSPISAGGGFTRTGIGTIVDMESLEIEVDVSENFINRVRPGQDATVRLNAYPDWELPARVIAIVPTADRAKATVKVRVGLETKDPRILPQMGVRVAFLDDPAAAPAAVREAALVPAAAVQPNGDTGVVFVINGSTVERRAVRLGERTAGRQVVLSGLTAGTLVAVGDLASLADGASVRIEK